MRQTVATRCRHEGEPVKGSRFIADVIPASTEAECRDALAAVAAEFSDASHHCSAWRLAQPAIERASDDGEPAGSAGRPILAQLVGRDLVDVGIIVTRYFGGTKLGVGGLVRAYGGAAGQALDTMNLLPWVDMCKLTFTHDYAITDTVERLALDMGASVLDRSFGTLVTVQLRMPTTVAHDFAASIADLTAGKIVLTPEDNGLPN